MRASVIHPFFWCPFLSIRSCRFASHPPFPFFAPSVLSFPQLIVLNYVQKRKVKKSMTAVRSVNPVKFPSKILAKYSCITEQVKGVFSREDDRLVWMRLNAVQGQLVQQVCSAAVLISWMFPPNSAVKYNMQCMYIFLIRQRDAENLGKENREREKGKRVKWTRYLVGLVLDSHHK